MKTDIRIVEIPDEFGGERYQLSQMFYDKEGFLINVDIIREFETYTQVVWFTDMMYKASLKSSALLREDGTYDL